MEKERSIIEVGLRAFEKGICSFEETVNFMIRRQKNTNIFNATSFFKGFWIGVIVQTIVLYFRNIY